MRIEFVCSPPRFQGKKASAESKSLFELLTSNQVQQHLPMPSLKSGPEAVSRNSQTDCKNRISKLFLTLLRMLDEKLFRQLLRYARSDCFTENCALSDKLGMLNEMLEIKSIS